MEKLVSERFADRPTRGQSTRGLGILISQIATIIEPQFTVRTFPRIGLYAGRPVKL